MSTIGFNVQNADAKLNLRISTVSNTINGLVAPVYIFYLLVSNAKIFGTLDFDLNPR